VCTALCRAVRRFVVLVVLAVLGLPPEPELRAVPHPLIRVAH
jgi:hypothetical protein